jgi:DNA-binding beta-propeller fold protein YncE
MRILIRDQIYTLSDLAALQAMDHLPYDNNLEGVQTLPYDNSQEAPANKLPEPKILSARTDILLEGQQQGDHQHGLMGVYELMEGKMVNGRGVWQMAGGQEYFMYYASTKQWWISDREDMEAGEAEGFMRVDSTAPTPDQITETWKVGDGTRWPDAPKVRARMCSAEESKNLNSMESGMSGDGSGSALAQGQEKEAVQVRPVRIEGGSGVAKIWAEDGTIYELSNLHKGLAQQLVAIFSSADETAEEVDWTCDRCTFLNEWSRERCEMCDNPKPALKADCVPEQGSEEEGGAAEGGAAAAEVDDLGDPIHASAMTADGTTYSLGTVHLAQTMRQLKERLGEMSDMSVGSQSMYLIEDTRQHEGDLELKNYETVRQIITYSINTLELQFAVMVGLNDNVFEFAKALPPSAKPMKLGDGTCGDDAVQLQSPFSIAFVPAHDELLIAASCGSNTVRVFRLRNPSSSSSDEYTAPSSDEYTAPELLCKFGRKGSADGEFDSPRGVAVTADSMHVVVVDHSNHRVQVLKLTVAPDSSSAQLAFVRVIADEGSHSLDTGLKGPFGAVLRQVGQRETVVVVEQRNNRLSEYELDGRFVKTIGEGQIRQPIDVTILSAGSEVAVTEYDTHMVSIYNLETGDRVRSFGSEGTSDGQFRRPVAITSDSHGHLLVLDEHTVRMQAFTQEGEHLLTRSDLGISTKGGYKGIEWNSSRSCLAIANGSDHQVLAWYS